VVWNSGVASGVEQAKQTDGGVRDQACGRQFGLFEPKLQQVIDHNDRFGQVHKYVMDAPSDWAWGQLSIDP
jgi:hypothetical protein